jgi:hypothetical protein
MIKEVYSRKISPINSKGKLLNQIIIHIILIGILFSVFFMATAGKVNARGVKQQVLEKQTALLIDSAISGMSFEIYKENLNGMVSNVELKNGRVYVDVAGLNSAKGYPYFSKYTVFIEETDDKFIVRVK